MSKIIFKNSLNQEIEFSADSKYRWTSVDDLGGISCEVQTTTGPFQDGVTPVGDSYFESRVIALKMIIVSDNIRSDLRYLNTVLNPKLGNRTLIYQSGDIERALKSVRVRALPTLPDGNNKGKRYQVSSIVFEAFDPLYTDVEATEIDVASGADLFSFPLDIVEDFIFSYTNNDGVIVSNDGDTETPIIIQIDGPVSAPLLIENLTTGEQIKIALDLLAGECLVIDTSITNTSVKKIDLDTREEENAFQYLDIANSTFFMLARGTNLIKVTANAFDVEQATLLYNNKYVGV